MTSIFSSALNAVKSNRGVRERSSDHHALTNEEVRGTGESEQGKSIWNRIKLNQEKGKNARTITIRKNDDDEDDYRRDFKTDSIQRKIITKDISDLKRPSKKIDTGTDVWKHDKYDGPAVTSTTSLYCTVFVRNLPENISQSQLREMLQSDKNLVGIRIDSGTAEMNFSRQDSAQVAADELNGKTVRGKKIKAAILGEINTSNGTGTKTLRTGNKSEESKEDSGRNVSKSKMHVDEDDGNRKSSILSRIKKAH